MDHPKDHSLFGLGLPRFIYFPLVDLKPSLLEVLEGRTRASGVCAGKLLVHKPASKECFTKN